MPTFIQNIASFISTNYSNTENLTIVMPSQRSKKYIQEALFQQFGKPYISPNFTTINAWVSNLVPFTIVSSVQLLFELYAVHIQISKENESFDDFLRWGKLLINDCDEIDRYLVDATMLFSNLRDVKEIENWSFDSEKELTDSQKKFIEFWDKLGGYYAQFNTRLKEKNCIYMGGAYRYVCEHIELAFDKNKDSHFLFVGFNALSPAEISIMRQLVNMGRASVLVEGDDFFINDTFHEGGVFLRKLKTEIPEIKLYSSNRLLTEEKHIEIISCAQPISQVKASMSVLQSLTKDELANTLLLLADESLIVPAIKHIPASVGEANITLGLPLKNTLLRTWVDLLTEIQENILYFDTKAAYHKTLIAFLQHPFFRKFIQKDEIEVVEKIIKDVIHYNKLFNKLDYPKLSATSQSFLQLAFRPWNGNWMFALEQFRELNQILFPAFDQEQDLIERSAVVQFDEAIKELIVVFSDNVPEMSLHVFKQLFNAHWMNKTVAYYGNPTEGLQIMGLLETRMLDFEQIIVIGMNEGKMPPSNMIQTIIPMDLRRFYQLPTPADKDALFAHHFYRLLPGAKKCWITYNSSSGDGLVPDEPSRYIRQLELELANDNKKVQFVKRNFELSVSGNNSIKPLIPASLATTNAVLSFFSRGISASALNKFLACPLDFYYKYILVLRENEEVEEDIESSSFGQIVHDTLEELYKPFCVNKIQVTEFDIDQLLKNYLIILHIQFAKHFNDQKEALKKGRNYLSVEMAAYQVERFLKSERTLLQQNPNKKLFILSLEESLETEIEIQWNGSTYPVKIKGFIDRVDSWGDEIRIVDYKTGKCTARQVQFKEDLVSMDFESLAKEFSKAKYALQLGIYNLLYFRNHSIFPASAGIISMTQLSAGYQRLVVSTKEDLIIDKDHIERMESLIQQITLEILNLTVFEHNKASKYCDYCLR
jgi:ATP-dependent helicase/nuclease subunit B